MGNGRNRSAERLYGFSAAEVLGKDAVELLVDPQDFALAHNIMQSVFHGENWTGQFPVKNKMGERFTIVATNTPFCDDDGSVVGVICVSSDARPFLSARVAPSGHRASEGDSGFSRSRSAVASKLGLDTQQPLQTAIASKISNLVSACS